MKKAGKNLSEIKALLVENGIRPTFQRIKILEFLSQSFSHPDAEEIYRNLSKKIPTLSRTTVYNTIGILLKKGIIKSLSIDENEIRCDSRTEPHAHFKCVNCGEILDISLDCEIFRAREIDGHKILEHHIYLKGICKKCQQNKGGKR